MWNLSSNSYLFPEYIILNIYFTLLFQFSKGIIPA